MTTEMVYGGSKEVAASLEISSSTLRKWSLTMESKGYLFVRDEQNRRMYTEADVELFRKLSDMLKRGVTLEHAVAELVGDAESPVPAATGMALALPSAGQPEYYQKTLDTLRHIEERINRQDEFLLQFTQAISKRLDESMSRYDSLNIAIRQIAATTEKTAKQQRRKKWYKFW